MLLFLNDNEIFSNLNVDIFKIGNTVGSKIKINSIVNISVKEAKDRWLNGLRNKL